MTKIAGRPEWVKSAVFYQIFPDRFAKSETLEKPRGLEPWDSAPTCNGFKGGDLLGATERLDWLVDLGVNAVYLNPIFTSTANHRYHTFDYMSVDPILGGDQSFTTFLNEAHRRGIRVILDGVFNHASRGFYQFNHTLENGKDSPYRDWFHFDEEPLLQGKSLRAYPEEPHHAPAYKAWWNLHALPKFNVRNSEARAYLLDCARKWTALGIDGWRLDVPAEIDDRSFWDEFREVVLSINPEAYLVGEIWDESPDWVRDGKPFHAVMNYPLTRALLGFCGGNHLDLPETHRVGSYRSIQPMNAEGFSKVIQRLFEVYGLETLGLQLNLLDSHDTPRFLTSVKGKEEILKQAFLFLCTFPGAPCVYYGDEIGMSGRHDPDCRKSFPWEKESHNHSVLASFRESIALRKQYPVLVSGEFHEIRTQDQEIYAFARLGNAGEPAVLVVLNTSDKEKTVTLDATQVSQRLRGATVTSLDLKPHGTAVLPFMMA
ncbi:MAG: hypothetical protein A2070_00410 [Bdellovibrionales bacterium GWC1_52_8]|nr:MAG: hypothetical protein A2Z97_14350 [Bdellovibrionales bacterium GWB1_52_6]OFZ06205.1 MAG: hypothetical protein A2X97_09130 [Bdellovibrionales bacterium GWA1_52_35]OFZ38003.1 MAG: hypothetical protein A2070_00410 [Bdellovibrionales bacterium GWC1_52_8]HCM41152.1 alpha-amylase [Bdellovibrionales bacterium]